MYVYIRSESDLWTVGFYRPDGVWVPESDHDTPDRAAERVAWLNGNSSVDPPVGRTPHVSRPHVGPIRKEE